MHRQLVKDDEMERIVNAFVACDPPTATSQQKGITMIGGKPHIYTKARIKQAKNDLAAMFAEHLPAEPLTGPVSVVIEFRCRHPKSHSQGRQRLEEPKPTAPDLDNLEKLLIDAIAPRAFVNDSQVAIKSSRKYWSPNPGITLEIWA